MPDITKLHSRLDPDPKFLFHFAGQAFFNSLIFFLLAARKFPVASKVVMIVTLSDQDSSLVANDGAADFNDRFAGRIFFHDPHFTLSLPVFKLIMPFMELAATAYSKIPIPEKAAENVAQSLLKKLNGAKPDTIILFATSHHRRHYQKILNRVAEITGARQIAGASGAGVLTDEMEIERQAGIAAMALPASSDFAASSFVIPDLQENNFRAGEKLGHFLRQDQINRTEMMLLFPDPFSFQSHLFFEGFESVGGYVPIAGAAASEDGGEEKTWQFGDGRTFFDSVSGLAFSGKVDCEIGLTRSCQPFGEPLQITRSEGNMIYEIEGRPAYDMLLESISHIEFDNPNQLFQKVFLGMPVRSFQTDFSSNYLIRNIMGINAKKGMLSCVSPVEEGEFVTFTVRDRDLARRDLHHMLTDMRLRFQDKKPAFGFYFNCCARGEMLYGEPNHDIQMIREEFPGLPVVGFFGYGELAPLDHVNHLHQHTGVLAMVAV